MSNPTLEITDEMINEIINHLGLTSITTSGTVNAATSRSSGNLIDFIYLIQQLEAGWIADSSAKPNSILKSALQKTRDFLFFLKETWILQNDMSIFEPLVEEVISTSQIMAIVDFVDLDKSGTLELNELQNAFRVCRRFSEKQMRADGSHNIFLKCLPYLRSRGIRLNDFLHMFDPLNTGEVTKNIMFKVFQSCGVRDGDNEIALMCLDAGDTDAVAIDVLKDAFKKAASNINKKEKAEKKRQKLREKKEQIMANAQATKIEQKNAFSKEDLDRAFDFLDYTNDGSVNIEETLAAFSKAKRSKIEAKMQRKGKMLLKQIHGILKRHCLTLEDFFNSMDTTFQRENAFEDTDSESEGEEGERNIPLNNKKITTSLEDSDDDIVRSSNRGGKGESDSPPPKRPKWMGKKKSSPKKDAEGRPIPPPRPTGCLSTYELRSGFKKMAMAHKSTKFTETDLVNLMRYVDPNGDGDISFDELEEAVARIYFESDEEKKRGEIFEILRKIDDVAKANGMMLMSVFFKMDKDGSGEVDKAEFISGVLELKKPDFGNRGGYHEPAFDDRGEADAAILRRDAENHERQHQELVELELSGAGPVLRKILSWTKERGLTTKALIEFLDKNKDGEVTTEEMVTGIKTFMQPSTRVLAAKKRKALKEAKKKSEDREKALEAHRLQQQIRHAEATGAISALASLEQFMRKNCMRCRDLFEDIDADGDGTVDGTELRRALKKSGLFLSKSDVRSLMNYLDTSGDGLVSSDELENAMKNFRRYTWQKDEILKLLKTVEDIPISERCKNLGDIFAVPLDNKGKDKDMGGEGGEENLSKYEGVLLTGTQVADGLMRMRGDKDARLWLLNDTVESSAKESEGGVGGVRGGDGGGGRKKKKKKYQNPNDLYLPKVKQNNKAKTRSLNATTSYFDDKKGLRGGTRKKKKGGGGLFGSTVSVGSTAGGGGGVLPEVTPAYVDRLYNLEQQSAFRALFLKDF